MTRHYHVLTDYYRGFVSLDYLKELDNSLTTGVKLRTRHLTFISHEASIIQTYRQQNIMKFKQMNEDMDVDQFGIHDEDSKISLSKAAARSEYSNYTN